MRAFEKYHPAVSAFYFFTVIIIAVFVWHPIIQLSALTGAAAFCFSLESPRKALKNTGFYIPLFLMVAVTNPLFSHKGVRLRRGYCRGGNRRNAGVQVHGGDYVK